MKYTLKKKRELIDTRPANQDLSSYCNDIGILLITNLFKANFFTLNEAKLANKKVLDQIICVD